MTLTKLELKETWPHLLKISFLTEPLQYIMETQA